MIYPKISIMIPAYNQESYIRKAIESALNISYPNLEIVLSDDKSTDNTFKIAKEYEKDSRFKAYRNSTNLGRVKNYHHLLYDLVSGDWVINCDGDDYLLESDFFIKAMEMYKNNNQIVLFSSNRFRFIESQNSLISQDSYGIGEELDGTQLFMNYFKYDHGLFHITSLYNREEALKANFYSTDIISSDIDSLLRIIIGKKVQHIDLPTAVWREHEENISGSIDVQKRVDNLKLITEVFKYHCSIKSLPLNLLVKWKRENLKLRVVRVGNKFLTNIQFKNFWKFISEVYKMEPSIVISALFYPKLFFTILFPFRKLIMNKIKRI